MIKNKGIKNKMRIKISKTSSTIIIHKAKVFRTMLIFVIVICLMPPQGLLAMIPVLNIVWKYLIILGIFISVIWYLYRIYRSKRIGKSLIVISMYFITVIILALQPGSSFFSCIANYLPLFSGLLLFESEQDNIEILFSVIHSYLFVLIIINLVCLLLFPNGMYKSISITEYELNWFLGYKSSFQFYLYPAFILSFIFLNYSKKQIISSLIVVLCLLEACLGKNYMLLVVLIVCIFLYYFINVDKLKIFNPFTCIVTLIIINIGLVSMYLLNIEFVNILLTKILNKSVTLSGRAIIWACTLINIHKKPWFGYGTLSIEQRYQTFHGVPHSHNQILQVLFEGGGIGLIVYLIIIFYVFVKLSKTFYLKTTKIILIAIFGLFIMGTVEILTHQQDVLIWMIFYLGCYSEKIDNQLVS